MVNKEILISVDEYEKRVAVVENGQLEEFFLERGNHEHYAGNIYRGKVAQVVRGMEAAFVDIGLPKNGFLYVDEYLPETFKNGEYAVETKESEKPPAGRQGIESLLRKGEEIMVQVLKEPFGTKGCRLTSQISLPGRFLVLMPYNPNIGISKKITNEKERLRLRSLLREIGLPKEMGCIIRTQALGLGRREFIRELQYLLRLWRNIRVRMARHKAPALLHEEYGLVLRITRDYFRDDIAQVFINTKEDYKRVLNFIKILAPHLQRRLKLYRDKMPLFEKYDVERQIDSIFIQRISLRKGGYIVIERTEALISVDVNSGSFTTTDKLEQTAFLTNLEAAKEIARQIRLRDLAGIIVIDFIDMQLESNRKRILQVLSRHMEMDRARLTIYPFSPLGLVQIARQRIRKNLENVIYQGCLACTGRGRIKSIQTIAIKVLRQIQNFIFAQKKRYLKVTVHPKVAVRLFNEDRLAITNIEKRMWVKIAIFTDEHLGIEEVKFL
ncbi:MAG: Rne/Rng family ribonuclease [Candidatus Omnitrophica bacterium]|nr:Rne/Rng family ribonuclease [Candidatus Omnitrophota bacterium]